MKIALVLLLTAQWSQALNWSIGGGSAVDSDSVDTTKLKTDSVTAAKVINAAISTNKLAEDSVTAAKVLNLAIGTNKLAADAVTEAKILNGVVGTTKIASGAVGSGKLSADIGGINSVSAKTFLGSGGQLTDVSGVLSGGVSQALGVWSGATTMAAGNGSISASSFTLFGATFTVTPTAIVTITGTGKVNGVGGEQFQFFGYSGQSGASVNNARVMFGGASRGLVIDTSGDTFETHLDSNMDHNAADIVFRTKVSATAVEVMRLTGAGKVGIGDAAPSVTLSIAGSAKISTVGLGTARALCMNSSNIVSTCTSLVAADGTCTCQN